MCIRDSAAAGLAPVRTDVVIAVGLSHAVLRVARRFDIAFSLVISSCLLYTSDAAAERSSVDLGGRRIIKKKKSTHNKQKKKRKKAHKDKTGVNH